MLCLLGDVRDHQVPGLLVDHHRQRVVDWLALGIVPGTWHNAVVALTPLHVVWTFMKPFISRPLVNPEAIPMSICGFVALKTSPF